MTVMKNKRKIENQNMHSETNSHAWTIDRRAKLKNEWLDLKGKPNLSLILIFGHICFIGDKLCKGPPGNSFGLYASRGHPPENGFTPSNNSTVLAQLCPTHKLKGELRMSLVHKKITTYQNQNVNTKTITNTFFYKHLNFMIMKKQILFLMVLVLVAFANLNKSYGQSCTPSELTPAAGVEYTYSVTNAGTGAKYDWYVTKDVNVLTAGSILTAGTMFTVNSATPYHDPATGVKDIKLTWTANAVADGGPFYLVIRYSETTSGTAGCTVENMKIHEIKPINSFLLALEGGTLSGTNYVATANSNTCAANITGAVVTPAAPTALLTYGQNTIYFVATASGIIGDWYPQIQLPTLQTSQVYVSAGWSSDMTGGGTFTAFPGLAATGATQDLLSTSPATASVAGTPILIKIVIDNVNWQTLNDQAITLKLDGFLPPAPINIGTSKSDVTSTTDCTPLAAFGRSATYTINKRPTITGTPTYIPLTNP